MLGPASAKAVILGVLGTNGIPHSILVEIQFAITCTIDLWHKKGKICWKSFDPGQPVTEPYWRYNQIKEIEFVAKPPVLKLDKIFAIPIFVAAASVECLPKTDLKASLQSHFSFVRCPPGQICHFKSNSLLLSPASLENKKKKENLQIRMTQP